MCKGTAYAKLVCRLEQGNPDSPTITNLVIKKKHDVRAIMSEEVRTMIQNDIKGHCVRYKFRVCDDDDGEVWIYMIGYCDDNSEFIMYS